LKTRTGFTLIELLIVIAIILILIAIALPNFLDAQTRAKVTRVKADMRSVVIALESYYSDYDQYLNIYYPQIGPPVGSNVAKRPGGGWLILVSYSGGRSGVGPPLTSPNKYLTEIPSDPFWESVLQDDYGSHFARTGSMYWGTREIYNDVSFGPYPWTVKPLHFVLQSCGPDLQQDGFQEGYGEGGTAEWPAPWYVYSPTNGTTSPGEILYYQQLGFLDQAKRG
jgi:prepilin-type N-terminal cleavage/methylation domain-containing protein